MKKEVNKSGNFPVDESHSNGYIPYTYLADISVTFGIPLGTADLLFELCNRMDNDNIITFSPYVTKSISEKTNIKPVTIRKYILESKRKNIMIPLSRGSYQMNPSHFGRKKYGNVKNIVIEYSENEISMEFIHEKKKR